VGIILSYAISMGQDAGCSCRNRSRLLVVSGDCGLGSSTAQRFRAKFIAHADPVSICFADAGLCPEPKSDSYRNSERPDAHQSQPYSKSNPNSDRHSDTNAARLSRAECHAYANANACAFGFSVTAALAPVQASSLFFPVFVIILCSMFDIRQSL
jgi:hypothetical protein